MRFHHQKMRAKKTSFVIEAKDEDDIYEALGEIDNDFFENHDKVKWVCSDYEPPIIDSVQRLNKTNEKFVYCTIKQQKEIQKMFDGVIDTLNKMEADSE